MGVLALDELGAGRGSLVSSEDVNREADFEEDGPGTRVVAWGWEEVKRVKSWAGRFEDMAKRW